MIEIGNNGQYNLSHFVNNLLLMATLEHQVFEQIQQRLDEETARKDVGNTVDLLFFTTAN